MNAQDNKIINGNCWVACFDLLGFKKAILGFEKLHGVGKLDRFAEVIYEGEILKELQRHVKNWNGIVCTCWASDTFVFYTPDDSGQSFKAISKVAILFCCGMVRHPPNPFRGALSGALGTGQFYADKQNNVFLGSAFIDAYEYAKKQNWIGFVVTPSAEKKIGDIESMLNIHTLLYQYKQYDVPVKKKVSRNEIRTYLKTLVYGIINGIFRVLGITSRCTVEDTELLFAAKIHCHWGIKKFFQQRVKNPPREEWIKKYENTLRFFNQCPCS